MHDLAASLDRAVSQETGIEVGYLTHPGADEDAEPDEDARILRRMKANYAARNEEIRLRWRDGAFHVDGASTIVGGMLAEIEAKRAERVFLVLLDETSGQGRHVSAASNSGNFAPKIFSRSPRREGFDKVAFMPPFSGVRDVLARTSRSPRGDDGGHGLHHRGRPPCRGFAQ